MARPRKPYNPNTAYSGKGKFDKNPIEIQNIISDLFNSIKYQIINKNQSKNNRFRY